MPIETVAREASGALLCRLVVKKVRASSTRNGLLALAAWRGTPQAKLALYLIGILGPASAILTLLTWERPLVRLSAVGITLIAMGLILWGVLAALRATKEPRSWFQIDQTRVSIGSNCSLETVAVDPAKPSKPRVDDEECSLAMSPDGRVVASLDEKFRLRVGVLVRCTGTVGEVWEFELAPHYPDREEVHPAVLAITRSFTGEDVRCVIGTSKKTAVFRGFFSSSGPKFEQKLPPARSAAFVGQWLVLIKNDGIAQVYSRGDPDDPDTATRLAGMDDDVKAVDSATIGPDTYLAATYDDGSGVVLQLDAGSLREFGRRKVNLKRPVDRITLVRSPGGHAMAIASQGVINRCVDLSDEQETAGV